MVKTGAIRLRCKHCPTFFKHPGLQTSAQISTITRHLKSCSSYQRHCRNQVEKPIQGYFVPKPSKQGNMPPSELNVVDKVVDFFISGNISFLQAENPQFQDLLRYISVNGKTPIINRKKIAKRLTELAVLAKEDLISQLATNESKISLALDCWSSRHNHSFIGKFPVTHILPFLIPKQQFFCVTSSTHTNHKIAITGHWIDNNFELQESLLSFREIKGSHEGSNLARVIYGVLDSFNIAERLFCITGDSASNNSKAMTHLSRLLREHKNINWDSELYYIRCLNHVLNLAVQAFLKKCRLLDKDAFIDKKGDESDLEVEDMSDKEDIETIMAIEEESEEEEEEGNDEDPWNDLTVQGEDTEALEEVGQSFYDLLQKLRAIVKVSALWNMSRTF